MEIRECNRTPITRHKDRWRGVLSLTLISIINVVLADEKRAARQPTITLSPAELKLESPSEPRSTGQPQTIYFKLTNSTGAAGRFCNFYSCWAPLIVSEGTGQAQFGGFYRDATRSAKPGDYPFLRAGGSVVRRNGCELRNDEAGTLLVMRDFIGGDAILGPLKLGNYKLCVSYHFSPDDQVSAIGLPGLHFKPEQIYSGWVMSNWINIKVLPPPAQKPP